MDIERTMAFIVEQQSNFETDIEKINQALTRTDKVVAENSAGIRDLRELTRRNAEAIRSLVEVTRLQSERAVGFQQAMSEIAPAHKDLTKTQKETARRLNDFIAQISRHLAGGNGRGRGPKKAGTK
ncbi:MAG TPA: hypothetical protein VKV95_22665 [Terriglobia bacterium]|nr:hypothetical protein [Terriglobia bacterium]